MSGVCRGESVVTEIPETGAASPLIVLRDAARGVWLRFGGPRRLLVAWRVEEVLPCLAELETAVAAGLHAAGFIAYEAAPAFDPALQVRPPETQWPLLWFALGPPPEPFAWPAPPVPVIAPDWRPDLTAARYRQRLRHIKALLGAGTVYQVNFTYRLRSTLRADPWLFFQQRVAAEQPRYGAYIDGGDWVLASLSPELFFRLDGQCISSRPMKGTAARGLWYQQDMAQAAALRASPKERAENLMITDMVRNDLGRIATPGSVTVPELFGVERYRSVWQMSSTVCATTSASLSHILTALFPAASITGAPKAMAMATIAALETSARHSYTGAIGFIAPARQAQFNVAIRSLWLDRRQGQAEYGVGGGIVWDARPAQEWRECQIKARALGSTAVEFELLETLAWTPAEGYRRLSRHLLRLARSAAYFAFKLDQCAVRRALARLVARLPPQPHRIRLQLSRDGTLQLSFQAYAVLPAMLQRIILARAPIDPADPFLYHKTTQRRVYQQALADRPGWDDVLLYNSRGEITESTIANVVVEIKGVHYTPPLRCGLLPGTHREALLACRQLRERVLTVEQLLSGARIYLINSVRGIGQVELQAGPD